MNDQRLPEFFDPGFFEPEAQEPDTHRRDAGRPEAPQRSPHLVPWIAVGIIAVLAIVASIVVVNLSRLGSADEAGSAPPPPPAAASAPPPRTSAPKPSATPPADTPPAADMGADPMPLSIEAWGVRADLSRKFGSTSYTIPDGTNLVFSSGLIDALPESCAAMRTGFGITRLPDGRYEVLRPDARCAAAPELYDEIWGQLAATVKTIRPL